MAGMQQFQMYRVNRRGISHCLAGHRYSDKCTIRRARSRCSRNDELRRPYEWRSYLKIHERVGAKNNRSQISVVTHLIHERDHAANLSRDIVTLERLAPDIEELSQRERTVRAAVRVDMNDSGSIVRVNLVKAFRDVEVHVVVGDSRIDDTDARGNRDLFAFYVKTYVSVYVISWRRVGDDARYAADRLTASAAWPIADRIVGSADGGCSGKGDIRADAGVNLRVLVAASGEKKCAHHCNQQQAERATKGATHLNLLVGVSTSYFGVPGENGSKSLNLS